MGKMKGCDRVLKDVIGYECESSVEHISNVFNQSHLLIVDNSSINCGIDNTFKLHTQWVNILTFILFKFLDTALHFASF